ncbi:MAG: glycosyltransferase [Bacteroidales bacterium]|nr:glycosyltransferase [Bacteroidales bacterium]
MMERYPGILFIASAYNWMPQYASAVLSDLWNDHSHIVVGIYREEDKWHFKDFPAERVHFFYYPKGWLKGKIFAMHPFGMIAEIKRLARLPEIGMALALTIDTPLSGFLPKLERSLPTIYVVHNIEPHKFSLACLRKRIFNRYFYAKPIKRLVRNMRWQITNARWQKSKLKEKYPTHKVAYLPFPSLVDSEIANGRESVKVLQGVEKYILFFGKVEPYKGVETLIEAYASNPALQAYPLVIAGKGQLSNPVPETIKERVIRVDEFVPDSQVASLFRHAAVAVYPYLKGTQSGVVSIASYFGTPIVASDIPFFQEIAEKSPEIKLSKAGDAASLASAITQALQSPENTRPVYDALYNNSHWRKEFLHIVKDFFPALMAAYGNP